MLKQLLRVFRVRFPRQFLGTEGIEKYANCLLGSLDNAQQWSKHVIGLETRVKAVLVAELVIPMTMEW